MRTGTVSYKLEDLRKGVIIPIGMVGENDFTRVIFDAEEVFKKHPDAQVTMKVQPPKGGIYPATVTRDGNTVTWQVKAADVAHRGSGELQLTFTADTMVEKSYIARTDIKRSLVGNGPAPDPVQDWVDNAEEVLEDLEAAEIHQPIIGLDGYWYTWNQGTGEYEKTNTKAQGQDGHSPVLTSSKSGKTTTIFADGDQLAQILDGEDGQGADVIDDTAGEGDTDKTWSADKLDTEITDVKSGLQGKYTKPSGGIPDTDLSSGVQDSLGLADTAYQKPNGGIPSTDIAEGVIPTVDSALSDSSENAVQNKVVKGALDTKAPVIINTATGNPAVFNDGWGMPIKSLLIPITLKQTGSGDPSPHNIRSIIPWNGLTIYHSGADTSNPTETDISFPSPVYGGEHEAVSGKLMSFYALLTKNTSSMNNSEDYPGWKNSGIEEIIGTGVNELIRNVLTNVSPVSNLSVGANTAFGGDVLYLNKSYFNKTQSEWKELAIDIQILVPIATPQEIQLTPTQITTLIGDNTIWSDADGQMTVEYPADTETFIANQHRNFIAPKLSSMIADTALVKNDFRIVGNNLYKITTAIASGGTLTPNTNCVKTTLAEVIKPLLT